MNIHEYQGKQLLKGFGAPVAEGVPVFKIEEAEAAAKAAGIFALLVHGIQTFLLILLGIYGLAALPFTNKTKKL